MHKGKLTRYFIGLIFAFNLTLANADGQDQTTQTLEVAQAFLMAAGSGDMNKLNELMADDFVWHNEGDSQIPWIGTWESKKTVLETFLPRFGAGLKVTSWTTDYSFVNGDQAVFMGTMSAIANETGKDTGVFSWAVRVHVEDGSVKGWNWFENSYAVSQAYHDKN
ncbi:nuclear transport factor 2 family protein [Vibrio sp. 10N.286.49.B1]|uniref:nuclear transport factor 2 family protein n=1 Tax=unclassified Vibrio TaxID=2614977 RepID=UPI000C85555C|nr:MULTISPECIES: nuclear transport factor 2 family protein [unclassified Vibrio]